MINPQAAWLINKLMDGQMNQTIPAAKSSMATQYAICQFTRGLALTRSRTRAMRLLANAATGHAGKIQAGGVSPVK